MTIMAICLRDQLLLSKSMKNCLSAFFRGGLVNTTAGSARGMNFHLCAVPCAPSRISACQKLDTAVIASYRERHAVIMLSLRLALRLFHEEALHRSPTYGRF